MEISIWLSSIQCAEGRNAEQRKWLWRFACEWDSLRERIIVVRGGTFSRNDAYLFFQIGGDSIFYSFLWGCRGGSSGDRVDLLG